MAKAYKYLVIRSYFFHTFSDYVNQRIEEGWQPIGGVSVTLLDDNEKMYCQAMITEEEDERSI